MKQIKKIIIPAVILLFISIIGIVSYSFSAPSTPLRIDNIELSNISLTNNDGVYTYKADVKSLVDQDINYIEINIKDGNNTKVTLVGYIGTSLKENETVVITASTDEDLSNYTTINYLVKK